MGSDSGLDPLGMARPSELIYQRLLPGISTITVRLRYYSFLPWVLHCYASEEHDPDPETFFKYQRNAEAIFALIGVYDENSGGLAGANWASRILSSTEGDEIDFGTSAQLPEGGLLKNKNGALGGIYGPQLQEMNLITSSQDHGIKIPTERGTQIALALEKTLGPLAKKMRVAIKSGLVSRADLAALAMLKPSAIVPTSEESRLLRAVLIAETENASPSDMARRDSLIRVLKFAKTSGTVPSDYELRWSWFDTLKGKSEIDPWLAYHLNDLLRLGYEALLKRSLEVMRAEPDKSIAFEKLVSTVLPANMPAAHEGFFAPMDLENDLEGLANLIIELGDKSNALTDVAIMAAIDLIKIILNWVDSREAEIANFFPPKSAFQSLTTELHFVRSLGERSQREGISAILVDRVLKRHLWVASRKFRAQSKYTFLFEPNEGRVRFRNDYDVKLGYPRISQAIQFLKDIKLLNDEVGLTEQGKSVLITA